jgi:para-aminobenzoate synthetase component I
MTLSQFECQANDLGQRKIPFLFVIDFEMQRPLLFELRNIDPQTLLYSINGATNAPAVMKRSTITPHLSCNPPSLDTYRNKFDVVFSHLENGNSYLTNLTIKTEVFLNCTLQNIFFYSKARYKLLMHDQLLVYSPEIFVKTAGSKIFSFPMKGTIDASINDAEKVILGDPKELAEHVTIVDLIRNDLSVVANNVRVERFRYIDLLTTNSKQLLQVSSEISGNIDPYYQHNVGSLLVKLLPAGSVSGAPKMKTVEIIQQAENEKRGYYTGVFGIFDGVNIDSAVMIRFIEKSQEQYYYRSGGGITTQSDCEGEYKEALNKIYVPVD